MSKLAHSNQETMDQIERDAREYDDEPPDAVVWKYPLSARFSDFALEMPAGAEVPHFAAQSGAPCLWARVTPSRPHEARRFLLRGTGHPVDPRARHVGTVVLEDARLVLHLFEAAP